MFLFWSMYCLTVIQLEVRTNSKHIITNEIVKIRQLFSSHVTFYHLVRFQLYIISHRHIVILIYQILHAFLHLLSHVLGFYVQSTLQEP